jgi:ribosomal protein L31
MKRFNELGITTEIKGFTGDKVKISKVVNREITVHAYRIEDSKFKDKGRCLHLQISINGNMHVVFTGSNTLMDTIEKVSKDSFPFITTIVQEDERFKFT